MSAAGRQRDELAKFALSPAAKGIGYPFLSLSINPRPKLALDISAQSCAALAVAPGDERTGSHQSCVPVVAPVACGTTWLDNEPLKVYLELSALT